MAGGVERKDRRDDLQWMPPCLPRRDYNAIDVSHGAERGEREREMYMRIERVATSRG